MYSDVGRLNCNVSYTTFATPIRGQVDEIRASVKFMILYKHLYLIPNSFFVRDQTTKSSLQCFIELWKVQ